MELKLKFDCLEYENLKKINLTHLHTLLHEIHELESVISIRKMTIFINSNPAYGQRLCSVLDMSIVLSDAVFRSFIEMLVHAIDGKFYKPKPQF